MFLASRLISGSRQLLRGNALTSSKIGEFRRGSHIIFVPPKNKVSSGALWAIGTVLFVSMWAYPTWVVYHIPDYQNENRNEYTGK